MPPAAESKRSLAGPDQGVMLRPGEMKLFQDLMYREAGIRLADVKTSLVQGRLRKRLEELGLDSFRAYHDHVVDPAHPDEFQRCLEALTTNETYFFRHKQHWDFILGTVLPEWRQAARGRESFRAWSAASSTGEEPYSLAIALDAGLAGSGCTARVDATDINTQVLARAKAGVYGQYALQKLTPDCLKRYFTATGPGHSQVNAKIRGMVEYRQHNLQEPSAGPSYDLVLLRNVLIYFDAASKATVIRHLAARIRPGGWLILGGAESLSDPTGTFTYVRPTIYRKRPS